MVIAPILFRSQEVEGREPDFAGVQSYVKFHYNIEKFARDFSHHDKILSKWKPMKKIILSINDVMCCNVRRISIVPYFKLSKYCNVSNVSCILKVELL